jgi:manganese/zinc/iron transport system substrate-binding protein
MTMQRCPLSRRALLTAALAAAALPSGAAFAQERRRALGVVATVAMVGDTVARIGGERVRVTTLMGEGVDPHTYRQTRADVNRLAGADMIFWMGLDLEAQLERLLTDFARRKPVVALGELLPRERLLAHSEYADRFDPHVWMDPTLWARAAEAARDALIVRDPAGADLFRRNAAGLIEELQRLDAYAKRVFPSVPERARVLITAHDAFNYFGRAYGLEVHGIQGLSTESEAGVREIQRLVDLLVERRIQAVFVESSVADRNVRALVEGAAARGHAVRIGGELFSDALGRPGSYEGTLIGMLDHNVTTIVRALGGEAPERGMQGRLGAGS